ncbi:hypothetical protein Tco_0503143 [Tanacetum coccineum]
MIKNGGNGSFRVVFPLVRLVSLLRGFNSSGLCFLNFFNYPRIIREQMIAAYGFERGDGVVRVRMSAQDPSIIYPLKDMVVSKACKSDEDTLGTINEVYKLKILDVGAIRSRLKLRCLSCCRGVWNRQKEAHGFWPSIMTMKQVQSLSQSCYHESRRSIGWLFSHGEVLNGLK